MSTLRANLLSNQAGTNRPSVSNGEFVDKRFNLNGTGTIAARDSFGIASFVDNGTGDYTGNFSVSYPNGNYTASTVSWGGAIVSIMGAGTPLVVGSARLTCFVSGAPIDVEIVSAAFVGDAP